MRRRPILPFMPHVTPPKTTDDYFALEDDGETELLDGEFVVSPAPSLRHQMAVIALAAILYRQAKSLRCGIVLTAPFDVVLSRTNIPHPDVLFLLAASLARLTKNVLQGPPDLAVEFLSPSNRNNDLKRKMKIYLECGVPQYWIGDPEARTIRVLENGGKAWVEMGIFKEGDVIRPWGNLDVTVEVGEVFESPI